MLFRANITTEVLQSEETLAEQLYIFLNDYVKARLKFESTTEREDCLQETIMYLLKRYREINSLHLEDINIEKFFYNRANSFISSYLRRLKNDREATLKYVQLEIRRIQEMGESSVEDLELVDEKILNEITVAYSLEDIYTKALGQLARKKLKYLGYSVTEEKVLDLDKSILEKLEALAFAVVDAYLIKSIESERDDYS